MYNESAVLKNAWWFLLSLMVLVKSLGLMLFHTVRDLCVTWTRPIAHSRAANDLLHAGLFVVIAGICCRIIYLVLVIKDRAEAELGALATVRVVSLWAF